MQPAELLPYLSSALVIIPLLPVIALIAVAWYQLRNL